MTEAAQAADFKKRELEIRGAYLQQLVNLALRTWRKSLRSLRLNTFFTAKGAKHIAKNAINKP